MKKIKSPGNDGSYSTRRVEESSESFDPRR